MKLALPTTLHTTFDEAVARTRHTLSEQGFGVLTEIDVKSTLKTNIDEDVEDYLILGACNPSWRTVRRMRTGRSGCCRHAT